MIAHLIFGTFLLVLGIILIHYSIKYCYKIKTYCIGAACLMIGIILILFMIMAPLAYKDFETRYQIQQEMYENFMPNDNNNLVYVMDIFETNEELVKLQSSKRMYKWWSCLPDSVLNLQPIGVE